jgi:hypothetical protein
VQGLSQEQVLVLVLAMAGSSAALSACGGDDGGGDVHRGCGCVSHPAACDCLPMLLLHHQCLLLRLQRELLGRW